MRKTDSRIRLTNWDALALAKLVRKGTPVEFKAAPQSIILLSVVMITARTSMTPMAKSVTAIVASPAKTYSSMR